VLTFLDFHGCAFHNKIAQMESEFKFNTLERDFYCILNRLVLCDCFIASAFNAMSSKDSVTHGLSANGRDRFHTFGSCRVGDECSRWDMCRSSDACQRDVNAIISKDQCITRLHVYHVFNLTICLERDVLQV